MKRTLFAITFGLSLAALSMSQAAEPTRGDLAQARAAKMVDAQWYEIMDTGPFISDTFRGPGNDADVMALKGIAIKVGADEDHTFLFDTEMLRMVAGFEGRVALAGTPWSGNHGGNSHTPGERSDYYFMTDRTPGWSLDGDWGDPRSDGHGPLPRDIAKYRGLYRHGSDVLLEYTVGNTEVWESPRFQSGAMVRHFKIGSTVQELQMVVVDPFPADRGEGNWNPIEPRLVGTAKGVKLESQVDGRMAVSYTHLTLPTSDLV